MLTAKLVKPLPALANIKPHATWHELLENDRDSGNGIVFRIFETLVHRLANPNIFDLQESVDYAVRSASLFAYPVYIKKALGATYLEVMSPYGLITSSCFSSYTAMQSLFAELNRRVLEQIN